MNVLQPAENSCLVTLPAELMDPDERPIIEACAPKGPREKRYIILDFSRVEMMNGLGATMLVKLSALMRRQEHRLLAFGVSDHYRNVLKVTGLDQVVAIYSRKEKAFAAAGLSATQIDYQETDYKTEKDLSYWAKPVSKLVVHSMPPEAINLNMKGRRIVGPVDGFGQLWQKKYQLKISRPDIITTDIIQTLEQNFPSFQPSYNRFYPTDNGITPGEVVLIDSSTPGGPVSTGVLVLYADDTSFTFITPQGHPESGWVTFSAFNTGDATIAQILGLARANDPLYEVAFRSVGSNMQVKIWTHVLTALANYLGIPADITVESSVIDKQLQWAQTGNLWYNAQIRTLLFLPFRWLRKP